MKAQTGFVSNLFQLAAQTPPDKGRIGYAGTLQHNLISRLAAPPSQGSLGLTVPASVMVGRATLADALLGALVGFLESIGFTIMVLLF
jgi:hypothetical protein